MALAAVALLAQVWASLLLPRGFILTASGDLTHCILLLAATVAMLMNMATPQRRVRVFWGLMATGMGLWFLTQLWWTYSEVYLRTEVPNPWSGDVLLFIHLVPMIGALALQPHLLRREQDVEPGKLDFLLLLLWWVYVYVFIVTPWQFVSFNTLTYGYSFDVVYLVENLAMLLMAGVLCLRTSGMWRGIYAQIFGAAFLYNLSSYFANVAIDLKLYYTGSIYDIPLSASMAWFVAAGALAGTSLSRQHRPASAAAPEGTPIWPARLATAAILSIPLMALWELFATSTPVAVTRFRLLCSLAAMLTLTFLVLLKQQLLNKRLMQLLREAQSAEKLQSALYRIAETTSSAGDLQKFYAAIHGIIGELMYAKNFYIALYDPATDIVSWPYFVDQYDAVQAPRKLGKGLTDYVLRTGQPLLALPENFGELVRKGEAELIGAASLDWMGVPLKDGESAFGVLVVQSYEQNVRFGEKEKEILTFVSRHVASALQHKNSQEALRRSELRYRSLVHSAVYGMFFATWNGKFVDVNPALVAMLGYDSPQGVMALNFATQLHVDPAEHARILQELRLKGNIKGWEARWKKKDGAVIAVRLSGRVLSNQDETEGMEIIVEDVTERRVLEEQFRQAQKMEAVGQLAGGVAHDFNNLLTVISGYTEILRQELAPDEALLEKTEAIRSAAARATELTKQLLAFSRKQTLETKVLDLNAVTTNTELMLRRVIGEDIDLVILRAEGLGMVKADPVRMDQVILNLAVNARDAMPNGGKLIIETANVHLDEEYAKRHAGVLPGEYVMLAVSDTGSGMSQETMSHIFEPFFTTKETGKGTGLGLAMVYGIVKQSGGSIWVYSELARGTTFKIYFPRVAERPEHESSAAAKNGLVRGSETILLVEDERRVRELVREILSQNGYVVLEASDGKNALELCERYHGKIDLMVTDVIMPAINGPELANRLVALRPSLKVLYMSGYTDAVNVHRGVLSSASAFLQKPFTVEALSGKVREVLDNGKKSKRVSQ